MPSGGTRLGAGRPPTLERQLAEAKKLHRQLQAFARAGLAVLAENFPQLVRESVEAALKGDAAERRFLIKTMLELVRPEDVEETLMDRLANRWGQQIIVNVGEPSANVAEAGRGPIIDAEYRDATGAG